LSETSGRLRRALPYVGLVSGGLAVGVLLLVAMEVALRLLGVAAGPHRDPFAGFSHVVRMFQPTVHDGVKVYQLSPARAISATGRTDAGPQREFLQQKLPGTFRIFVLGDSSGAGVPYGTGYAFSFWLQKRLENELPDVHFEVVNAAMPGYASRRLVTVAEEIAAYAPDLVIVYIGHNEFAERRYYAHLLDMDPRIFRLRELLVGTRLWGLASALLQGSGQQHDDGRPQIDMQALEKNEPREMFAVLDERAGGQGYATARERDYGEMLYRFNLRTIIHTLRAAGSRVMLVTLTQNFASWAPGASAHRDGLSAADLDKWTGMVADGDRWADTDHDYAKALAAYQEALAIDDHFADLVYREAKCEEQLGRFDAARLHYRRASDLDQVPHGAPTHFNDILREMAQTEGAMLTDADAAVSAASPHGLVGDDLFADWVHPNIHAHQIIAAAIATELWRAGVPVSPDRWVLGHYQDPDPEVLFAEKPKLRIGEHVARMGTCLLAHRKDCALAEVDASMAIEPENPYWQQTRAEVLRQAAGWPQ